MSNYYFYILYSESLGKYYMGSTSNLEERLKKHNYRHKGYTGQTSDWQLVYSEIYSKKELANQREKVIKKWKNKIRIKTLIDKGKSEHPDI